MNLNLICINMISDLILDSMDEIDGILFHLDIIKKKYLPEIENTNRHFRESENIIKSSIYDLEQIKNRLERLLAMSK